QSRAWAAAPDAPILCWTWRYREVRAGSPGTRWPGTSAEAQVRENSDHSRAASILPSVSACSNPERTRCGSSTVWADHGPGGARSEVGRTGDVRRGRAGPAGPGPYRCVGGVNVGGSVRCVRDVGPSGATPNPDRGQGGSGGRPRGRTGGLPPTAVVWPRSTKQWGRKELGGSRRGCRPPPSPVLR